MQGLKFRTQIQWDYRDETEVPRRAVAAQLQQNQLRLLESPILKAPILKMESIRRIVTFREE